MSTVALSIYLLKSRTKTVRPTPSAKPRPRPSFLTILLRTLATFAA